MGTRYLGIDWGEKRIGLSYADELGVAFPLNPICESDREIQLETLLSIIESRKIEELVIGYPYNMDGTVGFKARQVDEFISQLQKKCSLPLHRSDERLTSHQAEVDMKKTRKRRNERRERRTGELDSRAAAIILQDFLEEN